MNNNVLDLFIVETRERRLGARTLQYKKYEVDIYMNNNVLDLFIVETRERRLGARPAKHLMTSGSLIIRIKGGLKLRLVSMLLLFFTTRFTHI